MSRNSLIDSSFMRRSMDSRIDKNSLPAAVVPKQSPYYEETSPTFIKRKSHNNLNLANNRKSTSSTLINASSQIIKNLNSNSDSENYINK